METKRLYYIDWLRALVILTLIPFHAALTYLRFGVVYISKRHRLLLPIGFIILLELCLRPFFHPDAYIIIFDWANDAVYLSVFIFGYIFAADGRI